MAAVTQDVNIADLRRCVQVIPALRSWILDYLYRHRLLDIVRGFTAFEDLSKIGILHLRILSTDMWCVMKSEDAEHYPKILEFLEWSHKENPDLVCFRHYIKMCTALKAKIIVNMLVKQHNLLNILKSLNEFFPENGLQYAQATRRDIKKLKLCFQQFRKLVLRMIRDESFRKQYIEVDLENEYGERFTNALQKLFWEYLERLESAFPPPKIEQLLTGEISSDCTEEECILAELLQKQALSVPDMLQRLLQCIVEQDCSQELVPASSHDNCEPNLIASSLEASLYQESNCLEREGGCEKDHREQMNVCEDNSGLMETNDRNGTILGAISDLQMKQRGKKQAAVKQPNRHVSQRENNVCVDILVLPNKTKSSLVNGIMPQGTETLQVGTSLVYGKEIEQLSEDVEVGENLHETTTSVLEDVSYNDSHDQDEESMDVICLGDFDVTSLEDCSQGRTNTDASLANNFCKPDGPRVESDAYSTAPVFSALRMDSTSFEESEENMSPPDPFQSQKQSQLEKAMDPVPLYHYNRNVLSEPNEYQLDTDHIPYQPGERCGHRNGTWTVSVGVVEQLRVKMHQGGDAGKFLTDCMLCSEESRENICSRGRRTDIQSVDSLPNQTSAKMISPLISGLTRKCQPNGEKQSESMVSTQTLNSVHCINGIVAKQDKGVKLSMECQKHLSHSPNLQPVVLLSRLVLDEDLNRSLAREAFDANSCTSSAGCLHWAGSSTLGPDTVRNPTKAQIKEDSNDQESAENSFVSTYTSTSESCYTDLSDFEYIP
ncbi:uncharacterized protein LOC117424270 [Acipenser ruthenus]|uniref:uncharacterized protein LOC117424270 n=1 Tax=Acipenser ruthenus TaxID=7906 RepID=UPI00145AA52C|nr:uncharacterized protein LOC117424270 [Acipenser ruthenus]